MTTYHGSCDCGAVKFDCVLDNPASAIVCHCENCKIRNGVFASVLAVPEDKFSITSGADKLTKYSYPGDSGNPVPIFFCSICGTTVFKEPVSMAGMKIVLAGTLNKAWFSGEVKPTAFVYGNEKFDWVSTEGLKNLQA
ncbi:Mss4-like protein [Lipomyces arxii]|uniref:Mss4-like protein n=1 Tax=Lipomyces arxii TaxID=56418 RepID=UPI0034CF6303